LCALYENHEQRATYGAQSVQQVLVPLAIHIPIDTAFVRTADVFPTVLSHFGHTIYTSQIDGQVIR